MGIVMRKSIYTISRPHKFRCSFALKLDFAALGFRIRRRRRLQAAGLVAKPKWGRVEAAGPGNGARRLYMRFDFVHANAGAWNMACVTGSVMCPEPPASTDVTGGKQRRQLAFTQTDCFKCRRTYDICDRKQAELEIEIHISSRRVGSDVDVHAYFISGRSV